MTTEERKALMRIVNEALRPSIPVSQTDKELGRVELRTPTEANRLLNSPDFNTGWEACHAKLKEYVAWVIVADNVELRRFNATPHADMPPKRRG